MSHTRPRSFIYGLALLALLSMSACQATVTAALGNTRSITPTASPRPTGNPTRVPALAAASPRPTQTPRPTAASTPTPVPAVIRAIRVDYANVKTSRSEVNALEQKMIAAQTNLVAIGAGRLDWTYFKWKDHADSWSSDVKDTNLDFLAEDAARFGKWASVNAVVDVFAPRYIAAHPQSAAVSWLGKTSDQLVSTMQLVEGDFGRQLLDMLNYIAANYPVDSISITELSYYIDGYGDDDKAAYLAYTHRSDWPRNPLGLVAIDDPSIGQWRSYEIGRFLQRAADVVHRHGKQLYLDVEVSWNNLALEAADRGQSYAVMLQSADRLVLWDYFGLSHYRPDYTAQLAQYMQKYGSDRIIISIGLWTNSNNPISPTALRQAMQSGLQSPLPNLWITPSRYLTDQHWQVLTDLWGTQK